MAANTALSDGADVDAILETTYGATPLLLAANGGHTELVALLLERGARVNQQRADGTTALCAAAAAGHLAAAKVLLEHGADQALARKSGAGPRYLAAAVESSDGRRPDPKMVALLDQYS